MTYNEYICEPKEVLIMTSSSKKKKPEKNLERIGMRVPAALKEKYERAAALRGETFSGWAKSILDEAAEKQIKNHEFLEMAHKDRLAFAEAVVSPPKPSRKSIDAGKRYKKALGL